MKAFEIMTPRPIALLASLELGQAVHMMIENDISIAPVLSFDGSILGQVSEVSLLRAFILSQQTPDKKLLIDYKQVFKPADLVFESDSVDKVVKTLLKSHYNRVLVINSALKLSGIISPKDIIRNLMGQEKKNTSMLMELKKTQEKLSELHEELATKEKSLKTYEKFVQGSDYMMHSVDKNGIIVLANTRLHKSLGYMPGELIGKTIYDLYDPRHHGEVKESLNKLVETGVLDKNHSTFLTKAGGHVKVEVASSVLRTDKGEFVATSTISRVIDRDDLLRALHGVYSSETAIPGIDKVKK